MISLDTEFSINNFCMISSLPDGKDGPTRRINEDLLPFLERKGVPFNFADPIGAIEFHNCLKQISQAAKVGAKPLIHLDCHGDPDKGIQIARSGEWIKWNIIMDKLSKINRLTGNNTCVVAPTCFALQIFRSVRLDKVSPFFALLAPIGEISVGAIADNAVPFYNAILSGEDFIGSFQKHWSRDMRLILSDEVFVSMFLNTLTSMPLRPIEGRLIDPPVLRGVRVEVTPNIDKYRESFLMFRDKFLCGKASFSFDEVLSYAKSLQL